MILHIFGVWVGLKALNPEVLGFGVRGPKPH